MIETGTEKQVRIFKSNIFLLTFFAFQDIIYDVGYVKFEVICMTERREIRKGQRTQNFYKLKICNPEILSTPIKILVTPLRTHEMAPGDSPLL